MSEACSGGADASTTIVVAAATGGAGGGGGQIPDTSIPAAQIAGGLVVIGACLAGVAGIRRCNTTTAA